MILGIDFGTCFSTVAFMNGSRVLTDYLYDPNKTGIPTLFMYSNKEYRNKFGYECIGQEAIEHEEDVIRYVKKQIRENPNNINKTVYSGGKGYTLKSIIKLYLEYLINQAKIAAEESNEFYNTNIEEITITVPVGIKAGAMTASAYNELLRDLVSDITELDRSYVHILQEPIAAAISYLYNEDFKYNRKEDSNVLVFDLGGGTLDVSIVEYDADENSYSIKEKEGDLNLGGNDWDEALASYVKKQCGITGTFYSAIERAEFYNQIVSIKQRLTDFEDGLVVFKYNGQFKTCPIDRKVFEQVTSRLLDKAIAITKKAVKEYDDDFYGEIDRIVLVGGSSNMPQIKNRMIKEFPNLLSQDIIKYEPSKAIAKGAAVYSKVINEESSLSLTSELGDIEINDIVSHSYGFDSRKGGEKDMLYNVIYKGEEFEDDYIEKSTPKNFIPMNEYQKEVSYIIYESNVRKEDAIEDNWFELSDGEKNGMEVIVTVPNEYLGHARDYSMYPSIRIDKDGIFEFIVKDANGKQIGYGKKQL